jgi:hypothetical protein
MSYLIGQARELPAALRASCFSRRACVRFPLDNRLGFLSLDLPILVAMGINSLFH